jgi:aminocarboxymuconate-semialdehyde decarboxylase
MTRSSANQQRAAGREIPVHRHRWYAADPGLARRIVQAQNEGLAKWGAAHPDRFVALASVALQHPDLAAEPLEDGVKLLGRRSSECWSSCPQAPRTGFDRAPTSLSPGLSRWT